MPSAWRTGSGVNGPTAWWSAVPTDNYGGAATLQVEATTAKPGNNVAGYSFVGAGLALPKGAASSAPT